MARRIAEEDAAKAMMERGTQPLEPFPGTRETVAMPLPDMRRGKLTSLQ
jgi:hypothetical protein